MRILFAAGDVGGARAILPVARAAGAAGHDVLALDHGWLRAEGARDWRWMDPGTARSAPADAVIYGSSVSDRTAAEVAEAAQGRGVPILHVLDNWMNYARRLDGPDGRRLVPDLYAVMDAQARHEAEAEGVPRDILAVTGHPNLAHLADEAARFGPPPPAPPGVLFVSEPALADHGPAGAPDSRGYDEITVAHATMAALAPRLPADARLSVAPHPREDRAAVARRWRALADTHSMALDLVPADGVRAALHRASHVLGLTSILLYEAWLLGRPVASLQPGLRRPDLRSLSRRQGLVFCDTEAGLDAAVATLLDRRPGPPQPDLARHKSAAKRILTLAAGLKRHR